MNGFFLNKVNWWKISTFFHCTPLWPCTKWSMDRYWSLDQGLGITASQPFCWFAHVIHQTRIPSYTALSSNSDAHLSIFLCIRLWTGVRVNVLDVFIKTLFLQNQLNCSCGGNASEYLLPMLASTCLFFLLRKLDLLVDVSHLPTTAAMKRLTVFQLMLLLLSVQSVFSHWV